MYLNAINSLDLTFLEHFAQHQQNGRTLKCTWKHIPRQITFWAPENNLNIHKRTETMHSCSNTIMKLN